MSASTAAANRRSSLARSAGATARHAWKAPRARAIAASVSSALVRATVSTTPSVAGFTTSYVMVIGSHPFEAAEPLPVGDGGVEGGQLDPGHVGAVLHDLVAEDIACEGALLPQLERVAKRRGHAFGVGLVRVPLEGRLELQLVLDPVQTRG